jgi:hypothetical protein
MWGSGRWCPCPPCFRTRHQLLTAAAVYGGKRCSFVTRDVRVNGPEEASEPRPYAGTVTLVSVGDLGGFVG